MAPELTVTLDQIIPFSKARANLSSLIDKLGKKNYFVIAKKYTPAAALVDIKFLSRLLKAKYELEREASFQIFDEIRAQNKDKSLKEVEKDVTEAVRAVRVGQRS